MTRVIELTFGSDAQARKVRASRTRARLKQKYPIRAARSIALAHHIQADIDRGKYADGAEVARRHGVSRQRVSSLLSLLLLAPDIQQEVLFLEAAVGEKQITEKALIEIAKCPLWAEQRRRFAHLALPKPCY